MGGKNELVRGNGSIFANEFQVCGQIVLPARVDVALAEEGLRRVCLPENNN